MRHIDTIGPATRPARTLSNRPFARVAAFVLAALPLAALTPSAAHAQRLPGGATPRHYEIQLTPDLETGTLVGRESIDVEIPRATATITLHSVGFELRANAEIGENVLPASIALDPTRETAELGFDPPLPAGKARLTIEFTGRMRDDLRGLYRMRANDRWYAATQFEGTYARMMFPCFDEPSYKATFDLSVDVAEGSTAISNGALLKQSESVAGQRTLTFGTSPKMSTYLVALAIGDLRCVSGESDGVPVRVCGVPEKADLGKFALQAAEGFLRYYNGYYGIRYPFGKLDMVAVPDYEWGGMENTAAVFYKERALLVDPATASARTRRAVASVVAHEIAHQWFGDLVTMKWWDNIWLNEGFATWMSRKPLQTWDPAWDQNLEATRSAQQVLAADSLASTRPIRQNAATSAEIKELFDGVAYSKGAAMLRMVEAYVGEEVFRTGVNAYLSRHANGNATAEDFRSELARVSGRPVERVLASFIDQPGAPLVSVETRCEGGKTRVTLTQQRFFLDPQLLAAGSPEEWWVPVCMRAAASAKPQCELLTARRQTFTLNGCSPWVLLNADARGYYRTAYSADALAKISAAASTLSPAEQVALLEDQWALVRVGRVSIADYMALAEGLQGSRELVVSSLLIGRLQTIEGLLLEADRAAYRAWLVHLLQPAATELGFTVASTDSDDRRTLRSVVFSALGEAGAPDVVATARRMTEQAMADPSSIDPDLANAALPIAAAHGNAELYDRFLATMTAGSAGSAGTTGTARATPEQSFRWLTALASFRDEPQVRRSLELTRSPTTRNQDLAPFTSLLLSKSASRPLTWEFLKTHWTELQSKVVSFGGGGAVSALGNFCDTAAADDIDRFFTTHRAPAAERAVRHSLESIRTCAALKARLQQPLHEWLAKQTTNEPTPVER